MRPATAASPPRERARSTRAATAGLLAAAGLAVVWGAAVAWANSPAVTARLRARVERALRQRLPAASLGQGAAVDLLGRLHLGPLTVPASRRGAPPVIWAERVVVSPRWWALLAGRTEPAAVSLSRVRLEAGPAGDELTALSRRLTASGRPATRAPAGPGAAPPEIRFQDLVAALGPAQPDPERLELGPLTGTVEARGEQWRVSLRLPAGGRVAGVLVRSGGRSALRLAVEGAAFQDLPEALRRRLPVAATGGDLTATLQSDDLAAGADLAVKARRLELAGEPLGREPLGPFDLALAGRVRWNAGARRAAVERGSLALGPGGALALAFSAAATLGQDPTFSLEVRARDVEWAALRAALPPALVPDEVQRLDGPMGARLALEGPAHRPGEWRVEAELDLKELRRALRGTDPLGLAGEFTWRPPAADGLGPPLRVGRGNRDFVPLAELPHHVARAVTTSEDGGFFAHSGFDFEEIRKALAERADSGRVRGASTITQQLAKNLFLSGERTFSRKIREALLTVALEASLSKPRLLEIYLNIVEWGPGIHGIGRAARHYFGKDARDITPREAAFLASVIPAPARFHAHFARGDMPEYWSERIDAILLRMAAFGQLGEDELREALQQELVFARG
jgi:transglycosylase-like protein